MEAPKIRFKVRDEDNTLLGKQTQVTAIITLDDGREYATAAGFDYMSHDSRQYYRNIKDFIEGLKPYKESGKKEPPVESELWP